MSLILDRRGLLSKCSIKPLSPPHSPPRRMLRCLHRREPLEMIRTAGERKPRAPSRVRGSLEKWSYDWCFLGNFAALGVQQRWRGRRRRGRSVHVTENEPKESWVTSRCKSQLQPPGITSQDMWARIMPAQVNSVRSHQTDTTRAFTLCWKRPNPVRHVYVSISKATVTSSVQRKRELGLSWLHHAGGVQPLCLQPCFLFLFPTSRKH